MPDDQPITRTETLRRIVPSPARVVSPDRTRCRQGLRTAREQGAESGLTRLSAVVTEVDARRF
jgi:hypothetical protein